MDTKLVEALRAAFRATRDAGTVAAAGHGLTAAEALEVIDALEEAAALVEAAWLMCDCGRGPIVGGPVPVCLECELGPFGRAWEDEMRERAEYGAFGAF